MYQCLNLHFPNDVEHHFMCLFGIWYSLWWNIFMSLSIFKLKYYFLMLIFMSSLYILGTNSLFNMWLVNIFPHSVAHFFILLIGFFMEQKFLTLMKSNLLNFLFSNVLPAIKVFYIRVLSPCSLGLDSQIQYQSPARLLEHVLK